MRNLKSAENLMFQYKKKGNDHLHGEPPRSHFYHSHKPLYNAALCTQEWHSVKVAWQCALFRLLLISTLPYLKIDQAIFDRY